MATINILSENFLNLGDKEKKFGLFQKPLTIPSGIDI
jgi:hypothetical protein